MTYYHPQRLLRRYSVPLELHCHGGGRYENGRYLGGAAEVETLRGVVLALSEETVMQAGGQLTRDDRELYVSRPIEGWREAVLVHGGRRYRLQKEVCHRPHAPLATYWLKWCTAFYEDAVLSGEGGADATR